MDEIRYPIGKFEKPTSFQEEDVKQWVSDIRRLPIALREAVSGLNEEQLNTPYREGGWTVAQVVHHVADASMNAFLRTKWTLTENVPSIKPFDENAWAETVEACFSSVELSLQLLEGLHGRWGQLLETLKPEDFKRTFYHEGMKTAVDLYTFIAMCAWHGKHHTAQITALRERKKMVKKLPIRQLFYFARKARNKPRCFLFRNRSYFMLYCKIFRESK